MRTTKPPAAELKQKVSDDLDSISDLAKSGVSTASEKAKEAATDHKNVLARKLGSVAEALGKVSSELDRGENRDIGGLTRNLGTNLRNASESRIEASAKSPAWPKISGESSRWHF